MISRIYNSRSIYKTIKTIKTTSYVCSQSFSTYEMNAQLKMKQSYDAYPVFNQHINSYNSSPTEINLLSNQLKCCATSLNHIVVIPDGNRRWSNLNNVSTSIGYELGLAALYNAFKYILEIGNISVITSYAVSADNVNKRDKNELGECMDIICYLMLLIKNELSPKYGITINHMGNKQLLQPQHVDIINYVENETKIYKNNITINMQLAYDYNQEICDAIKTINHSEKKHDFTVDDLAQYMYTRYGGKKKFSYTDLVIRAGKRKRLSRFMPLNSLNTEIHFVDKFMPDLTIQDIHDSINTYAQTKRSFGK